MDSEAKPQGRKDDTGKLQLDLIPTDALWEVGKVYTMGATKYDPWNWRKGLKYSRVFAAMLRHVYKWWMGEQFDQQDGQRHLASVAWCALTLIHYDLAKEAESRQEKASGHWAGLDDRQIGWSEVWK